MLVWEQILKGKKINVKKLLYLDNQIVSSFIQIIFK